MEACPVLLVHGPKPPAYVLSAEKPAGAERVRRNAFIDEPCHQTWKDKNK